MLRYNIHACQKSAFQFVANLTQSLARLGVSGRGCRRVSYVATSIAAAALLLQPTRLYSQEAQWIWSPEHPRGQATQGDCFFRKSIVITSVEQASVTLTADDAYELFVNGQKIGAGNSINQLEQYDITRLLGRGRNVIAIRVVNRAPGPAALAARVFVKPRNRNWLSYSTDASWKTNIDHNPSWQLAGFNDSSWKPAQAFGMLGKTAPWDRREEANPQRISEGQRFRIDPQFTVDQVLDDELTGSLVNIAFNEFGHIIAAQESGPLLLIYDSDKDGVVDKVREYCKLIENIQGVLPLNGDVYVTGTGPEGLGVYRLVDRDRNGALEKATRLIPLKGDSSEHGPHGLTLGPDGKIYCVLGNHVRYADKFADSSPLKNTYEGDLITPRYEDPGGHATGVKAPGGTVIRFDVDGENVELIAGGLRNAFDLVFNSAGRLFVHDSDMESDEGAPWYRPTSLYEIVDGGEYGWRSGWAKWPTYYYDRLPPVLETGRGSPTGACNYAHFMFPVRFHDSLFLADWTAGQILCVRFDEEGRAQSEVFIEGQPLNVTDVAVGPDGWLYFCTGGRGTKGGIYQVRWRGTVPDSVKNLGDGIEQAIKQPQLDSAWARQSIATLKRELGSSWADDVAGVAFSNENPSKYRVRALDLMQLFGPTPNVDLLLSLSENSNEAVRAKAATLLGKQDNDLAEDRLLEMLEDEAQEVAQSAAAALTRAEKTPSAQQLTSLLASSNRRTSWTARRLLELLPSTEWRDTMLEHDDQRVRLQAGLALVIADPSEENCQATVAMCLGMLEEFVSDRNFIDLLRLVQVSVERGKIAPDALPELRQAMVSEYPVGEPLLNRELFRLLTYLNAESVIPQAISYLQSDAPLEERLHTAMHLRFFDHEWNASERYAIIKFFEEMQPAKAGSSVPLYVMNVTRDIAKDLPMSEARIFVSEGAKWPNAALVSLYQYPEKLAPSDLQTLIQLDQQIDRKGFEGEEYKRLRTGIVAMLSQHGSEESQDYLRQIWIRSPERKQAIALGLSMMPSDENWDYLVRSLPVLESYAVPAVMNSLLKFPAATDDSQALREVILHGLRMQAEGQSPAVPLKLLRYWTGQSFAASKPAAELQAWQEWYAKKFPDLPAANLPALEQSSPWNIETLDEYFASSDGRRGDPEHGRLVYEKAECAKCHSFQGTGTAIGPDLTTLTSRFTRKEVVESILYPSHIISDQYRTQRVLTVDGQVLTGVVSKEADGTLSIRDSNLDTHIVAEQDVEQIEASKTSLMPSGLIDNLTSAEIRDMVTFLGYGQAVQVADSNNDEAVR